MLKQLSPVASLIACTIHVLLGVILYCKGGLLVYSEPSPESHETLHLYRRGLDIQIWKNSTNL